MNKDPSWTDAAIEVSP